jgi:prefoldin subunit 5
MADELTRLRKADEYMKKSIHTLKAFREHVHAQIQEHGQKQNP